MPELEEQLRDNGCVVLPLFIYGTLHPDRAPASIAAVARRLKPLAGSTNRATIEGRLHNFGEYPGVILPEDTSGGADTVRGELFSLPDGQDAANVLARLDAYEDFRPSDPQNSLFLRQLTLATLESGAQLQCWVYTYNRPLTAAETR